MGTKLGITKVKILKSDVQNFSKYPLPHLPALVKTTEVLDNTN